MQLTQSAIRITIGSEDLENIQIPANFARKGRAAKFIIDDSGAVSGEPDPALLKLAAYAYAAQQAALSGRPEQLFSKYSERYIFKLMRLSWLAPDIIETFVSGQQPKNLNGRRLLRASNVPLEWAEQRRFFAG